MNSFPHYVLEKVLIILSAFLSFCKMKYNFLPNEVSYASYVVDSDMICRILITEFWKYKEIKFYSPSYSRLFSVDSFENKKEKVYVPWTSTIKTTKATRSSSREINSQLNENPIKRIIITNCDWGSYIVLSGHCRVRICLKIVAKFSKC